MRIRSIKPEFWRSSDITSLCIEDRLLFVGLWSYVDDNGVGRDEEASIVADLFAADMFGNPRETIARVSRGLSNLAEGDLIARYDVDGRPYLSIVKWSDHQRIDKPAKARYPRHDAENAIPRESVARVSRDPRAWSRGTEEQGNRGAGEETLLSPTPPSAPTLAGFDDFWAAYPKRSDKGHARTAWAKAVRKADVTAIIEGARRFGQDPNLPEPKFIPLAATWLNGERWEDGPLPDRRGSSNVDVKVEGHIELARRLHAQEQQHERLGIEQ